MNTFYEVDDNLQLVNSRGKIPNSISKEQIHKFFRDRTYRMAEDTIIQSLFFHHYLTKRNIQRFADLKLRERRLNDYSNVIKRMWMDGTIERFQYGMLFLYTLSEEVYEYARDKYGNLKRRFFYRPQAHNASKILECASLAQFHISILCGEEVRRARFYENILQGESTVFVPSYLEFKKNGYIYHVASYILPKDKNSLEDFFDTIKTRINSLRGKIRHGKNDIFLQIILTPDIQSIKNTAKIISTMKEIKETAFYFAIEEQTIAVEGLRILYCYHENEGELEIETITLPNHI